MYVSIGLHRLVKYIIDSLPRAQSRLRQEFNVSASFWKKGDCILVYSFPVGIFVCAHHNQSGYLAFKMAKVKDTKLTLAVIPFYVG